jgi:hypothetical protein
MDIIEDIVEIGDTNPLISFFADNIYLIILGVLLSIFIFWHYYNGNFAKFMEDNRGKMNEITGKSWLSTNMVGESISVDIPSLDI